MGVLLVLSAVQGNAECPAVATFPLATAGPLQNSFTSGSAHNQCYHLSLISLEAGAPLPPELSEAASVVTSLLPSVAVLLAPTTVHIITHKLLHCY